MQEELTLKQLCGVLLKRWRMLLLLGIILALALGGYRGYSLMKSADAGEKETAARAYEMELRAFELKKEGLERELEGLAEQVEEAEGYLKESLLMGVNAYEAEKAWLSVSVEAEPTGDAQADSARTERLMSYYGVLAQDCELKGLFQENPAVKDVEETYLRELVAVDEGRPGVLTIQALGTEAIPAGELARGLYGYLASKQAEVAALGGGHSLTILSETERTYTDTGLSGRQAQARQQPALLAKSMQDKATELEGLKEPAAPASTGGTAILKSGIKYAILGGVVGVFLGAVAAFLKETMRGKAESGGELARLFQCRYLGNLEGKKGKKGLDALGERLYGEDVYAGVAPEDRIALLAANLKEAAGEKRKLLLTGTLPEAALTELREELAGVLGRDYALASGGNLLVNPEAIGKLEEAEGVALVAGPASAHTEALLRQAQRVQDAGKELLGVIWK